MFRRYSSHYMSKHRANPCLRHATKINAGLRYKTSFWSYTQFTVYPKKYAHGFCFAVLCCGYTLTDFPISIRLTSLALWQSNDCPSASKATLMNMEKYFMWIHYERLHNHYKAKHNKTVCIFFGIYCTQIFKLIGYIYLNDKYTQPCVICIIPCGINPHQAFI